MRQAKKPARNSPAAAPADSPELRQALQGRTIPASPEAEAAVLGSMILDPECIGRIVETMKAEAFSKPEHQLIFEGLVTLYEDRNAIDLVLLRDTLKKQGRLTAAGGVDYLVRVAESVPNAASVDYYARIVQEKHMLRELAYTCQEILQDACDEVGAADEKLDLAEQKIFRITEQKIAGSAVPIKNLLHEAFEAIESRKGSDVTGISTGYRMLNQQLSGLQRGEMIIIAGRPSMGKTSFAMNMAEYIGADAGLPVVIFSLEMSKQQLVERILCSRSRIDSQIVRRGLINTEQHNLLVQTASELNDKPIFIDDTPGLTPLVIRAKCRRLKSHYDIQAVFIDYLQLMSLGANVESRQQEISTISRYLKSLARELNVPVVVLSQLNRSAEIREGHRPRMSDLRESGSIEQDADVILLLHREDYYHRGEPDYEETNKAEIIIAKQRNGPTGTVELLFNGRCTRFEELAPEYVQEPF